MFLLRFLSIFVFCVLSMNGHTAEFTPFVVKEIRVEGLERVSEGAFFNQFSFREGDTYSSELSSSITGEIFATGYFDNVQLQKEGDTLVIVVKERPAINDIKIEGNESIKTEELLKALEKQGLRKREILDRALLNRIEQELELQYFAGGRYNVQINIETVLLDNNAVDILIEINEGVVARIKEINLVGNHSFSEDELRDVFQSKSSNIWSFYTKSDNYSKQKLGGDLEALRSFYLDRGFIHFSIESTQVSLTPDKRWIYLTVNLVEGEQYTIGDVKLSGELIVDETLLLSGIADYVVAGDQFSRKAITSATSFITKSIGNEGYAFAKVNHVPEINEDSKTITLTFFITPGKRVYVRRINFFGNTKTVDEVLRREMRQLEGGWYSSSLIERSKVRLERLGYFSHVKVETVPVPGSVDLVDLNFTVVEQPSGNLTAGVGYAQQQGILFNFGVNQKNFLGTGNRVNFTLNHSKSSKVYNLEFTDPYFTKDGVSGSAKLFYQERDADKDNLFDFTKDAYGGALGLGIPLSENNRFRLGIEFADNVIKTSGLASEQVKDFFEDNGKDITIDNDFDYSAFTVNSSFTYDTRNRAIFPTKGSLHSVSGEVTLPGGDLQFYKLSYRSRWYFPIYGLAKRNRDWTFLLRGEVAFGDGYGKTNVYPFFENFYAGGMSSVRGFQDNTISPREVILNTVSADGVKSVEVLLGDPIGGNLRVQGGMDIFFPTPFLAEYKSVRTSAFVDFGNTIDTNFDFDKSDIKEKISKMDDIPAFDDIADFRVSTGVAVTWLTQLGPMSFSVGLPVLKEEQDQEQIFQFRFGANF